MAKPDLKSMMAQRMTKATTTDAEFVDEVYRGVFGADHGKVRKDAKLPLNLLHPFTTAKIGFQPYTEDNLKTLSEDIDSHGLMEPIIARPSEDGYEILSGHNRVAACRLLQWEEIPARVESADDARAITIATVTNLQRRQGLLPSERGWAYRALLEAKKCQGKRVDLTCVQIEHKLNPKEKTRDIVAKFFGVNPSQVQREIRLTYLIPAFMEQVDKKKLSQQIGLKLASYTEDEQLLLYQTINVPFSSGLLEHLPSGSFHDQTTLQNLLESYQPAVKASKTLSFQRTKFAPFLSKVESEEVLEAVILEFLQQKYGS